MDAGFCCGSRPRKGEVFAYVGLPHNLKDLEDANLTTLLQAKNRTLMPYTPAKVLVDAFVSPSRFYMSVALSLFFRSLRF